MTFEGIKNGNAEREEQGTSPVKVVIIGVGGGGSNAVDNMIAAGVNVQQVIFHTQCCHNFRCLYTLSAQFSRLRNNTFKLIHYHIFDDLFMFKQRIKTSYFQVDSHISGIFQIFYCILINPDFPILFHLQPVIR